MTLKSIASQRFYYHRIAALSLIGLVAIVGVRAHRLQWQHPPVNTAPTPELIQGEWINSKPLTMRSRLGEVTMVEFWAYECGNCRKNLPTYESWQRKYSPQGFSIIGIHTPETANEAKSENVRKFISERGIRYPVLLDPAYKNWHRWNQEFWPVLYLVDKRGRVRDKWVGELESYGNGGAAQFEARINELLAE